MEEEIICNRWKDLADGLFFVFFLVVHQSESLAATELLMTPQIITLDPEGEGLRFK